MAEEKICSVSGTKFNITDNDIVFYKKMNVPLPTLCPEERERRRMAWRNLRFLYKRGCDLCGENMIGSYPTSCPFPVYCEKCFWSDKWDPLEYGQEFDFKRPFFGQFKELANKVPRMAVTRAKCVNSDYSLNCLENKNCYLISGADYNEDCYYGINTQRSKSCIDHYLLYDSELCYGCLDSVKLYNCVGCQECENSSDCWFLYDCKGCQSCAFSSNLRNKKYVLRGKQLAKTEYKLQLKEILDETFKDPDWLDNERRKICEVAIHRDSLIINSENVSGNYVRNCRNSEWIFDAENLEDCKHIYYGLDAKDCMDCSCIGFECERLYELISGAFNYNCISLASSMYCKECQYCVSTYNAENCFGSISLKNHKKYVILNKQYSKEDYQILMLKIVHRMRKYGEWGEFFPPQLAPFEYNRSMAIDYNPVGREEALEKGFRWFEGEARVSEVSGDICACALCGKGFKIISPEAMLYCKFDVPEPKFCWACRLKKLIHSRKSNKLFDGSCVKCGCAILTPVNGDDDLKVYCEKCYKKAVYE